MRLGRDSSRRISSMGLAFVFILHGLFLFLWCLPRDENKVAHRDTFIVLSFANDSVKKAQLPTKADAASSKILSLVRPKMKPRLVPEIVQRTVDPAQTVSELNDPFALPIPAPSVSTGIDRSVAQISKDLMMESKNRPLLANSPMSPSAFQRFQSRIEAAGVPRGVSYKTFTVADGTRITKVITPHGSFCALAPKPGTPIILIGPMVRVMSCGIY